MMHDNNEILLHDTVHVQADSCCGMSKTVALAEQLRADADQELRFAQSLQQLARKNGRQRGLLCAMAQEHVQLSKRLQGYCFLLTAIRMVQKEVVPCSLPHGYACALRALYYLLDEQAHHYGSRAQCAEECALAQLYYAAASLCQKQQEQLLCLLN